jgi:hypothetical protein
VTSGKIKISMVIQNSRRPSQNASFPDVKKPPYKTLVKDITGVTLSQPLRNPQPRRLNNAHTPPAVILL